MGLVGAPLIAVIVPVAVIIIKLGIPRIPKALLPILAAALGPAAEAVLARWRSTRR